MPDLDQLIVSVHRREDWITATVEDYDGAVLGTSTAPAVLPAEFDERTAVIRDAVERALAFQTEQNKAPL